MKTTTETINIIDRHPHIKKAMDELDARPGTAELKGVYYTEALSKVLAMQVYGRVNDNTLYDAEMLIEMYMNDNGDEA